MLLDHASGAQRRASSVTVPTAREGESFAIGGSHLGLSEPHRLPARFAGAFSLCLRRPSLRALASPFGALPPGQSVLKAHCRVGSALAHFARLGAKARM